MGQPRVQRLPRIFCGGHARELLAFDREGKRLIGYWYGKYALGRGIASAALKQFLTIETQRPLHAWVIPSNAASMRVLEKNGFVRGEHHVDDKGVEEVLFTLER